MEPTPLELTEGVVRLARLQIEATQAQNEFNRTVTEVLQKMYILQAALVSHSFDENNPYQWELLNEIAGLIGRTHKGGN